MSQRGNKVFFDMYQTTPSGSNVQILTNNDAAPTTFSTDSQGSLVIANNWNGITIDNEVSSDPRITLGPDANFAARMQTDGGKNFSVHVNNRGSSSLLVNSAGNTTLSGNLTVNRETSLLGNLTISKHLYSGPRVAMSYTTNVTNSTVSGNDIIGTIQFNRVFGQAATFQVNFINPYTDPPRVVLFALNGESAKTPYYIDDIQNNYFTFTVGGIDNSEPCIYNYMVIG